MRKVIIATVPNKSLLNKIAEHVSTVLTGLSILTRITPSKVGVVEFVMLDVEDDLDDINLVIYDDLIEEIMEDPCASNFVEMDPLHFVDYNFLQWLSNLHLRTCVVYDLHNSTAHDLVKEKKYNFIDLLTEGPNAVEDE